MKLGILVCIVHTLSLSGACPLLRSCLVISVLINVYYLVYYFVRYLNCDGIILLLVILVERYVVVICHWWQHELVTAAEYAWSSVERTAADQFEFVSSFIDSNFTVHSTMTRLLADVTSLLLSTPRLPVDVRQLSTSLDRMISTLPLDGVSLDDDIRRLLGQFYDICGSKTLYFTNFRFFNFFL